MKRFWRVTSPELDRHQLLINIIERNRLWIEVADAKAAVVLVFATAILGFLAPSITAAIDAIQDTQWGETAVIRFVLVITFVVITLVIVAAGIRTVWCAFETLLPDIKQRRGDGATFFGDIAKREHKEWEKYIFALSAEKLLEDLIEQSHTTACIANAKHFSVQRAVRSVFIVVLLSPALYLVSWLVSQSP